MPERIALTPVGDCDICERREADCTVVIEDRIVAICDTCYQRADERGGDDA